MSSIERRWTVHVEGYPVVSTDDLTLDEAAVVEQVCGVPYTMMNPLASVKVAKALLVVLLIRAGATEDDAVKLAGKMPLKKLHGAFRYHSGPAPAEADAEAVAGDSPPPSAPMSATG